MDLNNIMPFKRYNEIKEMLDEKENAKICKICSQSGIAKVTHSDGKIVSIDPEGGPQLYILQRIGDYVIKYLAFNEDKSEYFVYMAL